MSLGYRHVAPQVPPQPHIYMGLETKYTGPTTMCGGNKFGSPPRGALRALNNPNVEGFSWALVEF